ncbi:ABC transporter substrate-binding protein [Vibrio sp. 10N.286.49.B3]|uniref:ABC transporter substrate-binding protein n=1 Tax=Vibrio sp. 10N.286.49.B3 TaxID=1880855 RepID=UPI000C842026|nr:ABC transporter substrate-binding protein [Vibrio sp. 10N.286.49.B3]PMH44561.1 ABC transporter substrate-binding protein [Vibrio sp. 10N.286.49.B3]
MAWPAFKALITTLIFSFSYSLLASTEYPLTVTDGLGNRVTFTQAPLKISSKTLFTDEVLLDLIEPHYLTSLTNLADNPNYSPFIDKLPQGIPLTALNIETIIANQPDVVFAANWSDAGKLAILKKAGITVYILQSPTTLPEIEAEIRQIGQIINRNDAAETVITTMQQRLITDVIIPDKQLTALDYNPWGTSSGDNSSWNSMLERAQLTNVISGYANDQYGQVPVSKELMVALNPDVLFIPGWVYGDKNAAEKFKQEVLSDPALKSVNAIQSGRVYEIPQVLRGVYSQYIADSIIFVNHSVYKN